MPPLLIERGYYLVLLVPVVRQTKKIVVCIADICIYHTGTLVVGNREYYYFQTTEYSTKQHRSNKERVRVSERENMHMRLLHKQAVLPYEALPSSKYDTKQTLQVQVIRRIEVSFRHLKFSEMFTSMYDTNRIKLSLSS